MLKYLVFFTLEHSGLNPLEGNIVCRSHVAIATITDSPMLTPQILSLFPIELATTIGRRSLTECVLLSGRSCSALLSYNEVSFSHEVSAIFFPLDSALLFVKALVLYTLVVVGVCFGFMTNGKVVRAQELFKKHIFLRRFHVLF